MEEVIIRHTMEKMEQLLKCHLFQERQQTRKRNQKKGTGITVYSFCIKKNSNLETKKIQKQSRFLRRRATLSRSQKTERKKLKKEHIMFR